MFIDMERFLLLVLSEIKVTHRVYPEWSHCKKYMCIKGLDILPKILTVILEWMFVVSAYPVSIFFS